MEKTTKKRKKSKRLKKRIGLIAVGGLSFVLTICLSVGATLAWFAGSTWASNDLYMGGPVYVEMAGRGHSEGTSGDGSNTANWTGGDGKLDIVASDRTTGTASGTDTDGKGGYSNILLPGQKLLIYSQARVFSTADYDSRNDGNYANQSSGANTNNISNGSATYTDGKGNVKTTTTSVLRAKFSINIEFDPSVGFNNFTDVSYANNYPVQSKDYTGDMGYKVDTTEYTFAAESADFASATADGYETGDTDKVKNLYWEGALGANAYTKSVTGEADAGDSDGDGNTTELIYTATYVGRRDAVAQSKVDTNKDGKVDGDDTDQDYWLKNMSSTDELKLIKAGTSKSIYEWKYVSKTEYNKAKATLAECGASGEAFVKMGSPFDGKTNSAGNASSEGTDGSGNKGTGNGFYGVWVVKDGAFQESDAFYQARTTAYLNSYVEHYVDEYDRDLVLKTINSLSTLEDAFNTAFKDLVNQSSDNILAGNIEGFKADELGSITYNEAAGTSDGINATWLYVDPTIGNDTNAGDVSTGVGGWWYLVESNSDTVASGNNLITTVVDNVENTKDSNPVTDTDEDTGVTTYTFANQVNNSVNKPINSNGKYDGTETAATAITESFARSEGATAATANEDLTRYGSDDTRILNAKLYEITPKYSKEVQGNGSTKIVSVSFPFVNGNFELPGRELTNIFANAKISFQISFQALQAFFPFADSIDACGSGTALAGTAKALNISNAIPIFNEAFDYLTVL